MTSTYNKAGNLRVSFGYKIGAGSYMGLHIIVAGTTLCMRPVSRYSINFVQFLVFLNGTPSRRKPRSPHPPGSGWKRSLPTAHTVISMR
jgi:hypothetical protein